MAKSSMDATRIWLVETLNVLGTKWTIDQKLTDFIPFYQQSPIEWSSLYEGLQKTGASIHGYLHVRERLSSIHIFEVFSWVTISCLLVLVVLLSRALKVQKSSLAINTRETRALTRELEQGKTISARQKDEVKRQGQHILQLQSNLGQAQVQISQAQQSNNIRSNQIIELNKSLKAQKETVKAMIESATKRNTSLKAANARIMDLQKELLALAAMKSQLTNLNKTQIQDISNLTTENLLLQAIDGRVPSISALDRQTFTAFAPPFVLVVIDGDAYSWNTSHFEQPELSAGRYAANSIKIEVQKYLLQNQGRIPLHSKIVTRVFINLGDSKYMRAASASFPRQFSESMPLFDFVDCGRGKERADSKIQELVHLFIANEQCYAIFLAAVTDHGFARLLEQYACIPAAKRKVVLVDPGFVSYEIAGLQYQSIQWPMVFKRKQVDPTSTAKWLNIQKKKKDDSSILHRVAARELILRMTGGVRSTYWHTTMIGNLKDSKHAAWKSERYRRPLHKQEK